MSSIQDIKKLLSETAPADIPAVLAAYRQDERAGVKKLVESCEKKYAAFVKEQARLEDMLIYEKKYYAKGTRLIAGIDEVGRGPLAGPVFAAAVILPENCKIDGLNDSKQLSPKKREELYDVITKKALAVGVGYADNKTIDHVNILQATYHAMRMAVNNLPTAPEQLLVDAVTIPDISVPQEAIIKGDAKSMSIAAASVVAKVLRDRIMVQLSKEYPGYDFENNMGYGTKKHYEGIRKLGLTSVHRFSFCKDVFNE